MAAIRSLKVKLIKGFLNITTRADVGCLMSATHDIPNSVSNENGLNFSYLNCNWTGLEIAHLFFLAVVFLLHKNPIQMAMKKTTNADAHDRPRTMHLVLDDLGFLVLVFIYGVEFWRGLGGGI
jgi:hypothetical protein